MKKSSVREIRSLAIVLLVILLALAAISGAYSKYTSTAKGSDSATVAKWSITVNGTDITGTDKITFDLFNTIKDSNGTADETDVTAGKIAPGTSGSFALAVKNLSDVTANYKLNLTATNASNIPIEYSTDQKTWNSDITKLNIAGTNLDKTTGANTTTVYWRWAFNGTDSTNFKTSQTDATDTALGTAGTAKVDVTAEVVATQVD